MAAPYYSTAQEVCVLLVDHHKESVIIDLLKSYEYKVKTVDMTSAAMSMLSKGKEKIDMMIINVDSPDLLSFQLLAQAVALDIVSLFVCEEQSVFLAKKALNIGAYLYLEKPLDKEIVKYLWQFVLREKARAENGDEEQTEEKTNNTEEESNNNTIILNGKYKLKKKKDRKGNEGESHNNKSVRRKTCTEWTVDLHAKFMEAVEQLGEGSCYPKEILEVMNIPGLTRMQVASHLQKCRNDNWRTPKVRKPIRHPRSSSGSQKRNSVKKFGTMPRLQTNLQQQVYNDQHNPFLSGSNNIGGGIQQQHYVPLFGMLQSQGPPIIENTNYKPEPMFIDHVQDENVTMMFDINPNDLGVANTNFQQYIGEPNMSDPSNIVAASYASGSHLNESENYDRYFDFSNMDHLFQDLGPLNSTLPHQHDTEFLQIYSDDQVAAMSSVQYLETTNCSDESS